MQAMIPAAGLGKRLRELTENVTKCMVKVNGITLIERMLAQLDALMLTRIVIIAGYKSNELKKFIATLDVRTPIVYVENNVYDKTNNIYSLYLARKYLCDEDTLLIESDIIFDDCILQELIDDPYPSLALVAKYESWMDGTVVTLREDNSIKDFLSKDKFMFADIGKYYKTVNIYKFSKSFSCSHYVPFLEAYYHALGYNEYYEQVLKVIVMLDKPGIKAKIQERGNWYEIDDIQDLDIAESIFNISASERLKKIQKRYGGYWRYPKLLDFCYLVNPYFPPQKLLDEIKANFERLVTQYPSGQRVNNLLAAKFFGVAPTEIVVGNGAAELINVLLNNTPGKIGVIVPTFEEYRNRREEDTVVFNPGNLHFSYNAVDIMGFFDKEDIGALVLINPDNPSGNYIPRGDVLRIADWAERRGLMLILDESFVDFADIEDTMITRETLNKHPRMAVVKSISKAYGVPGLRLGVLASGDEGLVTKIQEELPVWNINSYAEFYLQICEKYRDDFIDAISMFSPVRDRLYADLRDIPYLEPAASKANYITCRVTDGRIARDITEKLLIEQNILIKDLSGKAGIAGEYIRVAVKTPQENNMLIKALRSYV